MRHIADMLPWLVPFWIAGVVLFLPPACGELDLDAAVAPDRRLFRTGLLAGTIECS